MPEDLSLIGKLKRRWWRTLLGVVAAVALVMLVTNPELAALSFLFDPIVLDVAIVFLGTQLLMFNGRIRSFFAPTWSNFARHFKAFKQKG